MDINSIVAKRLELVDEKRIQQFGFQDDGYVSATLGMRDGFVCSPLLRYEVTGKDSLKMLDDKAEVVFVWKDIIVDGNELRVICNDVTEIYRIAE